jgi:hypothetical protein
MMAASGPDNMKSQQQVDNIFKRECGNSEGMPGLQGRTSDHGLVIDSGKLRARHLTTANVRMFTTQ